MTAIERQILKNQQAIMTVLKRLPGFSGSNWIDPELDATHELLWRDVVDRSERRRGVKP